MARSEDEREIRLRPAQPRVSRNEGAAWSSGFKLLMHYARTSRAWSNRAQGGKGKGSRPHYQRCAVRVTYLKNRVGGQLTDGNEVVEHFSRVQEGALKALSDQGISPTKASSLVCNYNSDTIIDQIEYVQFIISHDKRTKIQNPAGFIIYTIENEIPVPTEFVTSRRRRQQKERATAENEASLKRYRLEMEYDEFVHSEVDRAIAVEFPGEESTGKINQMIRERRRADERFGLLSLVQQSAMVRQLLRHELKDKITLPNFEEWCRNHEQTGLFSS